MGVRCDFQIKKNSFKCKDKKLRPRSKAVGKITRNPKTTNKTTTTTNTTTTTTTA